MLSPLAYRRQDQYAAHSRMDLLLALYDGAIARLGKAEMALTNGDVPVATPYMLKAQLIVVELAAGVRTEANPEMGTNMLRLYEYVADQLRTPRLKNVQDAKNVLMTLREGFDAVRDEANRMEKAGQFVGADRQHMLAATA